MVDSNYRPEIKDFSFDLTPKKFRINDDVYELIPDIPIGLFGNIISNIREVKINEDIEPVFKFFDEVMFEDSAKLFRIRAVDKKNPIGPKTLQAIVSWMLEEYGLRPTNPSDNLSNGSGGIGGNSMDGVQLETSSLNNLDSVDS